MYLVIVQFDVLPAQREPFRALALRHAVESLRDEPGTRLFRIIQDEALPDRFYAVEGYADRAAYDAHRRGPILARNRRSIAPLLAAAPVVLGRGLALDASGAG